MVRQIGHALTAWLLRIGLGRAVLVIAAFSVLSSVLITGVGIHLTLPDILLEEWIYFAILTPALISPVVGLVIMSLAYRLAEAQQVLARLAQTDPLTGIGNRRHFMESAASMPRAGLARRNGSRPAHARHRPLQATQRSSRSRCGGSRPDRGRAVLQPSPFKHTHFGKVGRRRVLHPDARCVDNRGLRDSGSPPHGHRCHAHRGCAERGIGQHRHCGHRQQYRRSGCVAQGRRPPSLPGQGCRSGPDQLRNGTQRIAIVRRRRALGGPTGHVRRGRGMPASRRASTEAAWRSRAAGPRA